MFLLLEPKVSCNDLNITDFCSCDEKQLSLPRWSENLVTKFELICVKTKQRALPDLFFNAGVTLACFLGILMDSMQVN